MITLDEEKYLNFLYNKASEIRGKIIDHAIWVEMLLSDILSHYFCDEDTKRNLFHSSVLNDAILTFAFKIKILKMIFDTTEPNLKLKFPKLISDLHRVRDIRNKIAHSSLDTSEEFISKRPNDRVQLNYYEGADKKQMIITDKEFREKMKKSTIVITELLSLQKVMLA